MTIQEKQTLQQVAQMARVVKRLTRNKTNLRNSASPPHWGAKVILLS